MDTGEFVVVGDFVGILGVLLNVGAFELELGCAFGAFVGPSLIVGATVPSPPDCSVGPLVGLGVNISTATWVSLHNLSNTVSCWSDMPPPPATPSISIPSTLGHPIVALPHAKTLYIPTNSCGSWENSVVSIPYSFVSSKPLAELWAKARNSSWESLPSELISAVSRLMEHWPRSTVRPHWSARLAVVGREIRCACAAW